MVAVGIIDEYWSGVLQRIQTDVEVFNRLIDHQGERGRENELSLARMLHGLLPGRLGIGSGLLFDVTDKYSKQMDVVLFDQVDSPTALAQTNQVLFPVEEVRLCIEIKSRLNAGGIRDAAMKKASINRLTLAHGYDRPLFALFAYDATSAPETVGANLAALDSAERPDLTCVLTPGMLAAAAADLEPSSSDGRFVHGVTLLHDLTAGRQRGVYVTAAAAAQGPHLYGGVPYPSVDFQGSETLADPSRALLLFCETLIRLLAKRDGRPIPVLSHYLPDTFRDIETVQ